MLTAQPRDGQTDAIEHHSLERELRSIQLENENLKRDLERLEIYAKRKSSRLLHHFFSWIDDKSTDTIVKKSITHSYKFADKSFEATAKVIHLLRAKPFSNTPVPLNVPLVSVIIPTFNYGKYLREAIASLQNQSLQDFEVILVDGGSTDGSTRDIVRAIEKEFSFVRVILQETKTYVAEDRLAGFQVAKGRYVFCLDADDVVAPSYLSQAVYVMETENVDVVTPWVRPFLDGKHDERSPDFSRLEWRCTGLPLPDVLQHNTCSTVAMFRKSFWEEKQIGYRLGRQHFEDWDFWIRMASKGARYRVIPSFLHRYRIHSTSLSAEIRGDESEHLEAVRTVWRKFLLDRTAIKVAKKLQDIEFRVKNPFVNLTRQSRLIKQDRRPRIIVIVPFLDLGGSNVLISEIFSQPALSGYQFVVISTEDPGSHMKLSGRKLMEKISPLVIDLHGLGKKEKVLMLKAWIETLDASMVIQFGSRALYDLLPTLKSDHPELPIIDHLFNTVGHTRATMDYKAYIDYRIVANAEVREHLQSRNIAGNTISVVHHGIDELRFCPESLTARESKRSGKLCVGFLGRFSSEKRPGDFVKIVKELPEVNGLMCGSGNLLPTIANEIIEAGLEGRIALMTADNNLDFYKEIDVLLVTSDVEGLPLVLLEAMALGIPCIASKVGGIPDVIQDGINGFLFPATQIQVAREKLARFASLGASAKKSISEEARKTILSQFTSVACANRYKQVFETLLSSH